MRRHAPLLAVLTVVGVLYVLTAPRFVLGGDNGEFATLYAKGGVAHPSGFPLYVLVLRLFTWLPASTPAQGAALVTAALALATAAVLHRAALAWGSSPLGALLATAVYALSPLAWDLGTQAEVFTLNALLAALILLASAPGANVDGTRRVAILALLAGFGLANNLTIVLLAPLGIYGVVLGMKDAAGRRARSAAIGLVTLLAGLSPYVWMMLEARRPNPDAWVWGDVGHVSGLLRHVLRTDYGTFDLTVSRGARHSTTQLVAFSRHALADLLWVPAVVGAATLVGTCFRVARARRFEAWANVALASAWVLSGPVVLSVVNVPPTGPGLAVVRRLYLLPELILCVPFAVGVSALLARTSLGMPARSGLVAASVSLGVILGLPVVGRERKPTVENYLLDTLRSLPERAVVLGSGDQRVFGFAYVQRALGLRRDVLFVSPILLHYGWYRHGISASLGARVPEPRGGSIDTVALAERVLEAGRPLFVTDPLSGAILRSFPSFPVGTVLRILPRGMSPPAPEELERANAELFGELTVDVPPASEDSVWAAGVAEAYARPWRALAEAFALVGRPEAAERCRGRAAHYGG